MLGQLIDQRALARTRRTGQPKNPSVTGLQEQRFQQLGPAWRAVLDHADSPRQSPQISRNVIAELVFGNRGSSYQCKAERKAFLWRIVITCHCG